MRKTDWRYKIFLWWSVRVLKCPFTVNFTPPGEDRLIGVGFAWSRDAAIKMQANYITPPPSISRTVRRQIRRSAAKAYKEAQK